MNGQQQRASATQAAPQQSAGSLARARRWALHRRAQRIRRLVVGVSLALFIILFAGIYVQMSTGHDPALNAAARRRANVQAKAAAKAKAQEATEGGTSARSSESQAGTGESAQGSSSSGSGSESSGSASGSESPSSSGSGEQSPGSSGSSGESGGSATPMTTSQS